MVAHQPPGDRVRAEASGDVRRQRRRQATVAEIKTTARRLLAGGGDALSLRAIARAMELTAPALYRYYPSYEDLVGDLTVDLFGELVQVLEEARDRLPPDDPPARLFAVSRAFRAWSLDHPRDFGLLFANPMRQLLEQDKPDQVSAAGQRFGMVFGELVAQLWQQRPFPDAGADLDPRIDEQLAAYDNILAGLLPAPALYVFLRCWARLYGTVTLEVFGHLRWALSNTEPLFEDTLADNARALGILDDYRRLTARQR